MFCVCLYACLCMMCPYKRTQFEIERQFDYSNGNTKSQLRQIIHFFFVFPFFSLLLILSRKYLSCLNHSKTKSFVYIALLHLFSIPCHLQSFDTSKAMNYSFTSHMQPAMLQITDTELEITTTLSGLSLLSYLIKLCSRYCHS